MWHIVVLWAALLSILDIFTPDVNHRLGMGRGVNPTCQVQDLLGNLPGYKKNAFLIA